MVVDVLGHGHWPDTASERGDASPVVPRDKVRTSARLGLNLAASDHRRLMSAPSSPDVDNSHLHQFPYGPGHPYNDEVCSTETVLKPY